MDDYYKFMWYKFLNCIHKDKYDAYYYFINKGLGLSV